MWQRTSRVEKIVTDVLSFAGVIQLGEIKHLNCYRISFALQREQELFFGNEAPLEIFKKFYQAPEYEPIYEDIQITFQHNNPCIFVKEINLLAVSNDAVLHIGNGDLVELESKTLNIRQLSSWNKSNKAIKKTELEFSSSE
jgi:spore germination protein PE